MTADIVAGLVRHVLTAVGPLISAWGVVDGETWLTIVGASSTVAGAGWSVYDKVRSRA